MRILHTIFIVPIISVVLIAVGIYHYNVQNGVDLLHTDYEKITYQLEGKNLTLLVADTPEKREKGLMYYRELKGVDGMIFIFPHKQYLNFWNKNTYMDLDLYWIEGKNIVGKGFLPSIEKSGKIIYANSPALVDRVIEIPAN